MWSWLVSGAGGEDVGQVDGRCLLVVETRHGGRCWCGVGGGVEERAEEPAVGDVVDEVVAVVCGAAFGEARVCVGGDGVGSKERSDLGGGASGWVDDDWFVDVVWGLGRIEHRLGWGCVGAGDGVCRLVRGATCRGHQRQG